MQNIKQKARIANLIVLILFVCIHLIFVGRVLFQNTQSPFAYVISFLTLILLIPGYLYAIPRTSHLARTIRIRNVHGKAKFRLYTADWFSVFGCTMGAILTYLLSVKLNQGAVLSASLIGLLSSFISMFKRESHTYELYPFCVYCGAFVGMSASFIMESMLCIIIAGFVAGLIYVSSKNILKGVGGRLGTFAFIGVFIVYFARNLRIDTVQMPQLYDRNLLHILVILITSVLGASLTFFVSSLTELSKVQASALLSFLIGLLFYFFPYFLSSDYNRLIPLVFMGSSFNGMSTNRLISQSQIIVSGIIFGLIFIFIHKHFNGFGGVIGTAACISVLTSLGIHKFRSMLKKF